MSSESNEKRAASLRGKHVNLTVYLAGAITHYESDSFIWREDFCEKYSERFNIVSPADKWDRMEHLRNTDQWPSAVVAGERRDIQNSHAVIAKIRPMSAGTSIGLVYAFLSGKTVVLFDEKAQSERDEDRLSPVVLFHQHAIYDNLEDCVSFIEKRHERRSVEELRSAQDDIVPWDEQILIREIQGMIDRLAASQPKKFDYLEGLNAQVLAEAVIMQLEDDLESGHLSINQVSSDQIRRITESIFMGQAYRDEMDSLAKHYIRYRDGIKKKREELDQRDTEAARYKTYLHDVKGKIGNIKREADEILDEDFLSGNRSDIVDCAKAILRNAQLILDLGESKRKEIESPEATGKIHIRSVVQDWAAADFRKNGDIVFHIDDISDELLVEIDRTMLESWLQVFADNARVHGQSSEDDKMQIVITASLNSGNEAYIDFWNSGNFIDRSKADSMFDESPENSKSRTDNWGHGLRGLCVQVEKLGGSINCTPCSSRKEASGKLDIIPSGKGSPRFRIDLPEIGSSTNVKMKILVADDNDEDRRSFIKSLSDHFEIIACSSIDEALEKATENSDLYGAVLDLNFNDEKGRDGVWLCGNLKRIKSNLIIAMASGKTSWSSPDTSWEQRALTEGADRTFAKESYKRKDLLGVFR